MFNQDTYDKVMCRECGYSCRHLSSHIRSKHNMNADNYRLKHPEAPLVCQEHRDNLSRNNPAKTEKFKKAHSNRMSGEGNPNYNKKLSSKQREKISKSLKGDKHPMWGKSHSQSTRDKMSDRNKGRNNPMYGKSAWVGRKHKPETKEKIALSRASYLSDNAYSTKRTGIEIICRDILKECGLKFLEQYRVENFVFDFMVECNNGNLFIEVNGDYWHGNPTIYKHLKGRQIFNKNRDIQKRKIAGENNVLYLWESDLNNRRELCKNLVIRFIQGDTSIQNSYELEE